jgi:hypothetical protein
VYNIGATSDVGGERTREGIYTAFRRLEAEKCASGIAVTPGSQ